jgi:outer membrane protein OmpA-like peptidoglycan-associated protein/tetratricopeptide (TPR) repeat protein
MTKRILYIIFILSVIFLSSGCLSVRLRNANESYAQFAYATAAKDYEYYLSRKNDDKAVVNIADCYRQLNNPAKMEFWYKRALKLENASVDWNLYLAEALMRNKNYTDAAVNLEKYLEVSSLDFRAQRLLSACKNQEQFYSDTTLFTIETLKLNTPGDNFFCPTFYRSGIVFLSDKTYKGLHRTVSDGTGKRYLDLFYAKKTDKGNWLDVEPLRGDLNGKFNEGPAVFSSDFSAMYFTRNNYESNKVEKNANNVNVLKIYKAEFSEGLWIMKGDMYFNSGEFSVGHPAISKDESTFYFVSDMPWGYGGTDIYMVKYQGGNNWSQPINLGPNVNTEGNEMFPFLLNDSILYFSSNGLEGVGGLDIYETNFKNDAWSKPFNLGVPINSSQDDFSFILDTTSLSGYFTSSRNGISDKIYSFTKNPPKLDLQLNLFNSNTEVPATQVNIDVFQDGKPFTKVVSDKNGVAIIPVSEDHNYDFVFDNPEYLYKTASASTLSKRFSQRMVQRVDLDKVELNKPFIWEGVKFKKKDWQMALSSGLPLEKLATFLIENPRLNIELISYTDSRGTDADNLSLTQTRAELVKQYLTSKGVKASRITPKGLGESKLLNKCSNGLLCIEEEHEVNNRIEISVKSISKDTAQK